MKVEDTGTGAFLTGPNLRKAGSRMVQKENRAVWRRLIADDDGQDLVEYALVGGLLALGAVAALKSVASGVVGVFQTVGSTLTTAT